MITEQQLIAAGLLEEGHGLPPEALEEYARLYESELDDSAAHAVPRLKDVLIEIMGSKAMFRFPGAEPVESFEGVILQTRDQNTWYEKPYAEGVTDAPACASADGRTGSRVRETRNTAHGPQEVFGDCATCFFNQFGSDRGGGDGKDCTNHKTMIVKVPGQEIPLILRASPKSIDAVRSYYVFLRRQKLVPSAVRTRFTLKPETDKYSLLVLEMVKRLAPELFLDAGRLKASPMINALLGAPVATEQPAQLEAPTDVSGHTAQQSMRQEHEPAQQPGTGAGKPGW